MTLWLRQIDCIVVFLNKPSISVRVVSEIRNCEQIFLDLLNLPDYFRDYDEKLFVSESRILWRFSLLTPPVIFWKTIYEPLYMVRLSAFISKHSWNKEYFSQNEEMEKVVFSWTINFFSTFIMGQKVF